MSLEHPDLQAAWRLSVAQQNFSSLRQPLRQLLHGLRWNESSFHSGQSQPGCTHSQARLEYMMAEYPTSTDYCRHYFPSLVVDISSVYMFFVHRCLMFLGEETPLLLRLNFGPERLSLLPFGKSSFAVEGPIDLGILARPVVLGASLQRARGPFDGGDGRTQQRWSALHLQKRADAIELVVSEGDLKTRSIYSPIDCLP